MPANASGSVRRGAVFACLLLVTMTVQAVCAAPLDAAGHWAEEGLVCAQVLGLLQGYPDGTVRPDAALSRIELVALVCRAIGEEENSRAAGRLLPVFPDIPSDHWAVGYARVCYETGLVLGDERGMALPDKPVSRAEAAVIFARVARLLELQGGAALEGDFLDLEQIPGWALVDVNYAVERGLLKGDDKGRFRPLDDLSRAEAVTVLMRLLSLQGSVWDFAGVMQSVDQQMSSITITILGEPMRLRVSTGTLVYRNGLLVTVSDLFEGDVVGVLLNRNGSSSVAFVSSNWSW